MSDNKKASYIVAAIYEANKSGRRIQINVYSLCDILRQNSITFLRR